MSAVLLVTVFPWVAITKFYKPGSFYKQQKSISCSTVWGSEIRMPSWSREDLPLSFRLLVSSPGGRF